MRNRFQTGLMLGCLLLWAATFTLAPSLVGRDPAFAQAPVISEIVIEGTQRIEPGTVRSYMLIQEGDALDPARVDRSLKSLFATGLFADVTVERQGTRLIVKVLENPIINRIAFEGNEEITNETLQAEVSLRPRVIYTRTKVQNDVQRILTLYRRSGRFAATVEPKIITLEQNRVDLVFEISEGDPTEVRRISFVGNQHFDDAALRQEIRTKESRWYRFLSSDDNYDPDRLTLDRELLRRFYLNEGYADFRVISAVAELTPDREDFFITFTVDEGERYTFGEVDVNPTLTDLSREDLLPAIEAEPGDWYDSREVETTIDRISDIVGTLGYAFVEVRPRVRRDRGARTISIVYQVNEGPRVFVEKIEIQGNVRTADEVIRREFRLLEGDAFNTAKLRRSRSRLQNLDFFDRIQVDQLPGSAPDKTVIQVEVQEKSTGSLSVGFGFSSSQGVLGDIGVRERNLLGRGYDLGLKATIAQRRQEIDLSFTDPYFLNRDIAAGFDLFRVTEDLQESSSFDSKELGGALRAGYGLTESIRQNWKYLYRQTEVIDVDSDASPFIRAEEGKRSVSEVSHTLTYDTTDSRLDPTDGEFISFTTSVAGLLGDTEYVKNRFRFRSFHPLAPQWVLAFKASAGHVVGIGEDVRLLDRFFVGGDNLRGFETGGIGPRDRTTDDSLGGELFYTGTVELLMPIGLPPELGIGGKIFVDAGNLTGVDPSDSRIIDSDSIRAAAGVGVTWKSPFGPIGVDLGLPFIDESEDKTELFKVSFGTRF